MADAEKMGKHRGSGEEGRYEEKGGRQQVKSSFGEATDNEKIKAIYCNYNLWSWFRYWWLDTENFFTILLMDKAYYDYVYGRPRITEPSKVRPRATKSLRKDFLV